MDEWRKTLGGFFEESKKAQEQETGSELARFIANKVVPAFGEIADELEKHGRDVTMRNAVTSAVMIVHCDGDEELSYRVQGRTFPNGVLPYAEIRFRERKGLKMIRAESMFRSGTEVYRLVDVTKEEIIKNFLENYMPRAKTD